MNPSLAGDLNPPPGAPAPTPGPEPRTAINAANTPGDADSTYRIAQPGSYYLTGNITGVAAESGIEIAASNVTIDLMGFSLQGVPGSLDGIRSSGGEIRNTTVHSGVIEGFGGDGINLCVSGLEKGLLLERVHATGNGVAGITAPLSSIVRLCLVTSNQLGMRTCSHCVVESCTARENSDVGIDAGLQSILRDCVVESNGDEGLFAGGGSVIETCASIGNGATGILAGSACTVSGCSSFFNTSHGFDVGNSSTVSGCTATSNEGDGIVVEDGSAVLDNTCDRNGRSTGDGAGIRATGFDNRITGNNCTGADRGIDIDGTSNIIIRNTCSGNTTNYSIAIGNSLGPIISAGTNAVAINGSIAAGTLGSTDPWANFAY